MFEHEKQKTFSFCECKNFPSICLYVVYTKTWLLFKLPVVSFFVPKKGALKRKINILRETYGLFSNVSGTVISIHLYYGGVYKFIQG